MEEFTQTYSVPLIKGLLLSPTPLDFIASFMTYPGTLSPYTAVVAMATLTIAVILEIESRSFEG